MGAEKKRDDGDEDRDEDGVRDNVSVRDKAVYKIKLGIKKIMPGMRILVRMGMRME